MPTAPSRRLAAALLLSLAAGAQAEDSGFEPELWVTTGFLSRHTHRAERYNQRNDGLGLEWRVSPQVQLNAGHYRNSVRHGSTYAQVAWMPLDWQAPSAWHVRGGASVGAVNGYPKLHGGGYFATLVPALSLERERFGVNLLYIPSVGKKVDGAYALQLKLRVL